MNKLVSIISPCYNGAKYLPLFLESILSQTYRPIELIFIDDGSTDNTKEVFESYRERLTASDIIPIYIFEENAGQAAAINVGLPIFKGDFLMWVDSDDILLPDNISKKVEYLGRNPDKGFVFCEGMIVNASDINNSLGILSRQIDGPLDNIELFKDLIMEKNVVFVPAAIMTRRQAVLHSIPLLHIYESRQGQNWQLMLPLAYCCEYGLIPEILFKYVVHDDSHSHKARTLEEIFARMDQFEILIRNTVDSIHQMPDAEKSAWNKKVHIKYLRSKMRLAYHRGKFARGRKYANELKRSNEFFLGDTMLLILARTVVSKLKRLILKGRRLCQGQKMQLKTLHLEYWVKLLHFCFCF